jgi:4-methylaminobutanoate oxidase (formaldehyde-forming)
LSYVGELGWELYIPTEYAAAVYDTLFEAGGDLGLIDAGMNALTSLRIEKGYRAWGADLTPDYTPFEAGLGFAVKFDKRTNFIGRDALRKLRETPPSRRLIMLTLNDPAVLVHGGEPIVYGETIVGQITSCAYGHTVGHAVAMGYIDLGKPVTAATLKNASFTLELAGECVAVTATLKAPYDAKGERLHV